MKTPFIKLVFVSFAAVGALVMAQTPDQTSPAPAVESHHRVDPQRQLDHLSKKLALTADQQNQILPILTDRQHQVSSIMTDAALSPKERHAKLKNLRADSESKIRGILTDTQRSALDQMQQEAHDRARSRRQSAIQ